MIKPAVNCCIMVSGRNLLRFVIPFVALLLYVYTAAPAVTFVDSGEIAAAVATRGVSHPSGSPFYHLLASFVAAIPFGSVIRRLNLFSAICAAASAGLTFVLFQQLPVSASNPTSSKEKEKKKKKKRQTEVSHQHQKQQPGWIMHFLHSQNLVLAAATAASFAWMTVKALWSTATVTEVYALHALLLVSMSLCLFWPDQKLFLASFIGGLAISNYPPFGIVAPAVILLLWRREGKDFWKKWSRNLIILAFFIAGLLPYVLLPIRAAADPLLNWGNPVTLENFLKHITAEQYRVFLNSPKLELIPKIFQLWFAQWNPFLLILIPIGIWTTRKLWPEMFLYTFAIAALNIVYMMSYDVSDVESAPSDLLVYIIPMCWSASIWMGTGLAWIIRQCSNRISSARTVIRFAPYILCCLPLVSLITSWKQINKRDYTHADDFARSILNHAASNAFILCPDWTFVSPALYLQHVESVRPDVLVLDGELLRRSWYFQYLRKSAPWLYEATQEPIQSFLRELTKYERGEPYDGMVITERYVAMLNSLLEQSFHLGHPPYILLNRETKEADPAGYRSLERALGRPPYISAGVDPQLIGNSFRWIPENVAFRLEPDDAPVMLREVEIPSRPYRLSDDYDNVTRGVIFRYADFWRWRGDFLRSQQDCYQAKIAYARALQIVPDLPEALEGQQECK